MALSGLEQLLIGAGLSLASGAITGGIVLIKTTKDRVSVDACEAFRVRVEEAHRKDCPINRDLLSLEDHREICRSNTATIHDRQVSFEERLLRMDAKMDRLLDVQRKAITSEDMMAMIAAMRKNVE